MKVWQGKARERILGLVTIWAALLIFVCSASIAHQFTAGDQVAQAHAVYLIASAREAGVARGAAGHVAGAHTEGNPNGATDSDGNSYPGSNYYSGQPGQTEPSGPANSAPTVSIDPVEPVYPVNPNPPVDDPPVPMPVEPVDPMPVDPPYCGGCGVNPTYKNKGIVCPMQSNMMMPTYCLL